MCGVHAHRKAAVRDTRRKRGGHGGVLRHSQARKPRTSLPIPVSRRCLANTAALRPRCLRLSEEDRDRCKALDPKGPRRRQRVVTEGLDFGVRGGEEQADRGWGSAYPPARRRQLQVNGRASGFCAARPIRPDSRAACGGVRGRLALRPGPFPICPPAEPAMPLPWPGRPRLARAAYLLHSTRQSAESEDCNDRIPHILRPKGPTPLFASAASSCIALHSSSGLPTPWHRARPTSVPIRSRLQVSISGASRSTPPL